MPKKFLPYFCLVALQLFAIPYPANHAPLLANPSPETPKAKTPLSLKQVNKNNASKVPDDKFMARLDELADADLKDQYLGSIEKFSEIPTEKPEYQSIVARMLQHQDKVFEMLGNCDSDRAEEIKSSSFYQVGENQYIFQRVCFLAAYNINYVFYLYSETPNGVEVKPLNLVSFQRDESGKLLKSESNVLVGFSDFDEQTRELSTDTKYRGVGDCGSRGKYKFQDSEFVLQEFSADFKCDGDLRYQKVYP
jgi:hypothetical protein